MNWPPPPIDFRARLVAANASADALQRDDVLAALADIVDGIKKLKG